MKKLILILSLLLFSHAISQGYIDVTPGYRVKLPEDFYFKKDYRIQWWYFTGHLFDKNGREFGYELTFFVVGVQQRNYKSRFGVNNIFISHFAITDIRNNKFYFSESAETGVFNFAGAKEDELKVWVGEDILRGNINLIYIKASDNKKMLNLKLIPVKRVVLHGEKGYSRKSEESPLISSIYFSYTNMKSEGEIQIDDQIFKVTGKSWFDREISSRRLSENQEGWDWFGIQLNNEKEIMLYILRNKKGSMDKFSSGTIIYPDGRFRHLLKNEFKIKALSYYKSRKTKAKYPSKWVVSIPSEGLTLTITPFIEDQEVVAYSTTGNYYWEGACKVSGTLNGRAYVEMTGY